MFGIRRGKQVLCYKNSPGNRFVLREFVIDPVLKKSPLEIDQILQNVMVDFQDYSLVVFELTEEDSQQYLINKLKGY